MDEYYSNDEPQGRDIEDPILPMKQLGQTIAEGQNVGNKSFFQTLQAAIHEGAAKVELSLGGGHMGEGPDFYSEEKKEELRNIAEVAEVDLVSIHTPVNKVSNLSGFGQDQQGGMTFSERNQEEQLNEVKKAIRFASDTTRGGAIIVHTGEYPRPISQFGEFEQYEGSKDKEFLTVVNSEQGNLQQLPKNHKVPLPEYEVSEDGYFLDRDGNKIDLSQAEDETERERMLLRRKIKEDETTGDPKVDEKEINEHIQDLVQKGLADPEHPEVDFWKEFQRNRLSQTYNQELYYKAMAAQAKDRMERVKSEFENQREQLRNYTGADKDQKLRQLEEQYEKQMFNSRQEVEHAESTARSSRVQLTRELHDLGNWTSADDYGKEKAAEGFAKAGMYAMQVSKEKNKDLKGNPIFVAPENIFPEMGYGSHPEELRDLVLEARKQMVNDLVTKQGWDEKQAKKEAEEHIKATFDTEHMGMWKRYFKRNPGETEEQFNQRFNEWFEQQSKMLADSNVVGHTHLADGFGYGHANLPPGQGNLPVKKAVEYLKEKGYKGAFLSEGYGDPPNQLKQAWKYFGSSIYSHYTPRMPIKRWDDMWNQYQSNIQTPKYMFGKYVPSKEFAGEPFWSGVPLE